MRGAILAALLLLAGCADKPDMPIGAAAAPPIGASDYCARYPGDEMCKLTP